MGLLSGFDDMTGWALLQKDAPALEKAYAADTSSASDIAYFKSVASTLTTPAKLLANYRALSFVTTAYGLGSEVGQTAILQKLMTQNPNASTSLAQQLADNNYRNFAYALSNWKPPPFSTQAGINTVIAGYQRNSFETSIGTDNTALQEAEYFTNTAKGLTQLDQIMGDPALLSVVTTALGIPSTAFGNLDYDQQVAILTPRVDMKQFSTAAGVASFVQKYLAMDELNQVTAGASTTASGSSSSSSSTASVSLTSLFSGTGASGGISQDITLSAAATMPGSLNILL